MDNTVLQMEKIDKTFPGVHALDHVDFNLQKGEVHALLGENGAGKSTLIKILAGIIHQDSGKIKIQGKEEDIKTPIDARKAGISVIHQELILSENTSVADNIFMGREFLKGAVVDRKKTNEAARRVLDKIGVDLEPMEIVSKISTANQQVVEIAKALSIEASIIVMDEPTSSLTDKEVDMLFKTIDRLKKQEVSVIYISHRMEEIFKIADRVTVLRDGKYIGTKAIGDTNYDDLISMMVGREISNYYVHDKHYKEEIVFEVKNFTTDDKLKGVDIYLKKGEILGMAGLVGAGRTELARAIFGIDKIASGEMFLFGEKIENANAKEAIKKGIALVPESRKEEGLVLVQDVGFNLTICVLEKFIHFIRVKKKKEHAIINDFFGKLSIKAHSSEQIVESLSGGNQQKVVVAKWLTTNPRVLILDEPTRGIDVGAKAEIYNLMNQLTAEGVSIIMISSELPEIIGMCDRAYVMCEGRISGCLSGSEIEQERIMRYATGVVENE